jgi:hypothetical protein
VEDRISGLKDKIDIKEKNRRKKKFKSCEKNMPKLCDFINRPNLQIMGIGEKVQTKCMHKCGWTWVT